MQINFNVLDRQYRMYQSEYEDKALKVLRKGWYILGEEVTLFEKEFASYIGTEFSVGLASGLDALIIAFRALGIGEGDEVIVQANAYIACVMGITINGARPVFVEPDEFYNIDPSKIEEKITEKTKAILVVHLYGQTADMEKIQLIAKQHNLKIVEDCAQSHGSVYKGTLSGSFSDIACFSFYPSKNLGGFGDGGAITTNDVKLAQMVKVLRNYGSEKRYHNMVVGFNSRLDELQAGLLRVKLQHIDELNQEREKLAHRYLDLVKNNKISLPMVREHASSVWHLFVICSQERDRLQEYLTLNGIGTVIHYPIPPHLSEAYQYLGFKENDFPITEEYSNSILSLPLYNGMTEEEQDYVIEVLNNFK
ncbi:DegT/DnrJ/EryC1/StrS family aminotransferase [Neobacillus sp. PS3-12]|uniref:DegT/DnrJ/EryC1/StrS family aminotransferase n=1 Tax=Neobacillus sp. PS3-12 TaxID=3070677 RepID=UPI0027DFF194|nr:DegT/DnrJ/EryC1/StrS family aminotransferase [Neobacillus sp. PS3-12]WML54786.1 DegT/DnrJ/EryC1/StrS family aminotransferase [Neobacillus sp. PS3-12]